MTESFSSNIIKIIDNYVDIFLTTLSTKYNIEKDELSFIWNESLSQQHTHPTTTITPTPPSTIPFVPIQVSLSKPPSKQPSKKTDKKQPVKSAKINFPVISSTATATTSEYKDTDTVILDTVILDTVILDTVNVDNADTDQNEVDVIKQGTDNDSFDLEKLSKKELIVLCKEKKIKCTGTKEMLIDFLTKTDPGFTRVQKKPLSVTKNTQPKISFSPDNKKKKVKVIKAIKHEHQTLKLSKNEHGNYMHVESNLIFDKITQKVIGKQNGDKIDKINVDDIEKCKFYNFDYDIPFNLDSSKEEYLIEKIDDDEIDEIEDELIEEELEDMEELEEEEDEY